MADVTEFGSSDEAAAAIQAILNGGGQAQPEAGADDEGNEEEIAAAIDAQQSAPVEGAEAEEPNTGEGASEEETPADTPDEGTEAEPVKQEPEPVKAAPKVEPQAQTPQPQTNNLSQIGQMVMALQIQLAAQFPDIKTLDDLTKLATEDPARYIQYDVQTKRLQSAQQLHAAAMSEQRGSWLAQEQEKLNKAIPDIADPAKGPILRERLVSFAKEQGYTPEQINSAASADIVILHDAMMYRDSLRHKEAEAAKQAKAIEAAKAKAKDAPKVQKPGAAAPVISKGAEKEKELSERFERTGHPDDLAALLAHRGF